MRIAVLIIGLIVTILSALQSCTVFTLSSVAEQQATSESASLGVLMAVFFLLGTALVMAFPRMAAALFALGSLLGLLASSGGKFGDLGVWALVGLALAVMAFFGRREVKRRDANQPHQ